MAQTQVRGARIRRWTLAALAAATIAGCMPNGSGGPSSSGSADPPYTRGPTVAISGTVTYQRVPADPSGLLYGSQYFTPARGAVVEVRDASDFTLVERGNCDAAGHYALHAAQNIANYVIVLAELGSPRAPEVAILDANSGNGPDPGDATFGRAVWGFAQSVTPAAATTLDIPMASGVDASGTYAATRPAAPFAILDVIYNERKWIRSADPNAVFPRMAAQWATNVTNGTFYDPATDIITVNGQVGVDTDEYDTHVIAHEWGHYFVAHFSRDDSLGGSHFSGDILDDTVAWSEGFATGLSGIVTSDLPGVEPLGHWYVDTYWTSPTTPAALTQDLEAQGFATSAIAAKDPGRTQDGYWYEDGLSEMVYDLWDDTPAEPGDPLALGFTPIFRTMVNTQKRTPFFTSAITFLNGLENETPGDVSAIRAEAARWDIGPPPYGYGLAELNTPASMHRMKRYTHLQGDGTVYGLNMDGDALKVDITDQTNTDYFNKLFARQFFVAEGLGGGRYTITVTAANPGDEQMLEVLFPGDQTPKYPIGLNPFVVTVDTTGGDLIFSVGLQFGYGPADIPFTVSVEPVTSPLAAPVGSG